MSRARLPSLGQCWATLLLLASLLAPTASPAAAPAKADPPAAAPQKSASIPLGKGLPVVVRTGMAFLSLEGFDEGKATFEATTDLRLTWYDPGLRYPAAESLHGYKEFRMSAAEEQLANLWTPTLRFPNRVGEPTFSQRRLRIFPDGRIETITRTTAVYKTSVDVARFPFDRQALAVELQVAEDTVETVALETLSDDMTFSQAAKRVELNGWEIGRVNLKRDLSAGWNGDRYAKVTAVLDVRRVWAGTIATIFIPLFASLLIPFMATWMNRAIDGHFEIEGFELANFIIGGLFAVIALSFAINSAAPTLAQGDNTVSRLLALNYLALAVGLLITVVFYRYRLPARWFGSHVQDEIFQVLAWAFPVLFLSIGLGFLLMAAA